jgi:hypothetical protein
VDRYDDGYIHVTQDDGKTWTNVTPRELNAWSKVVMLEASHFDANEAYAAFDRHRLEDNEPYIYRTKDGGKTWQKITNGLPAGVYLQTVKEDPKRRGPARAGHRARRVRVVQRRRPVAVAAAQPAALLDARPRVPRQRSHRRDARPRLLGARRHQRTASGSADVVSSDAFLFKPADAYPDPAEYDNGTPTQKDEPEADNPPSGAVIDYYLKSAAAGPVTIEILNAAAPSFAATRAAIRRRSSTSTPSPSTSHGRACPSRCRRPRACTDGCGISGRIRRLVAVAAAGAAPAEAAAVAVAGRRRSRRAPTLCA